MSRARATRCCQHINILIDTYGFQGHHLRCFTGSQPDTVVPIISGRRVLSCRQGIGNATGHIQFSIVRKSTCQSFGLRVKISEIVHCHTRSALCYAQYRITIQRILSNRNFLILYPRVRRQSAAVLVIDMIAGLSLHSGSIGTVLRMVSHAVAVRIGAVLVTRHLRHGLRIAAALVMLVCAACRRCIFRRAGRDRCPGEQAHYHAQRQKHG